MTARSTRRKRSPKRPYDLRTHDFYQVIQHRLDELGVSRYGFVKHGNSGLSDTTVYRFLSGNADCTSESLKAMLKAVGLEIRARKTQPRWVSAAKTDPR